MQHKSISNAVVHMKLALANGTVLELSPDAHPHLFKAARVSVGRLGIILEVTLKVRALYGPIECQPASIFSNCDQSNTS
jgi:FAD/FMN-containing dehydrogenase